MDVCPAKRLEILRWKALKKSPIRNFYPSAQAAKQVDSLINDPNFDFLADDRDFFLAEVTKAFENSTDLNLLDSRLSSAVFVRDEAIEVESKSAKESQNQSEEIASFPWSLIRWLSTNRLRSILAIPLVSALLRKETKVSNAQIAEKDAKSAANRTRDLANDAQVNWDGGLDSTAREVAIALSETSYARNLREGMSAVSLSDQHRDANLVMPTAKWDETSKRLSSPQLFVVKLFLK